MGGPADLLRTFAHLTKCIAQIVDCGIYGLFYFSMSLEAGMAEAVEGYRREGWL